MANVTLLRVKSKLGSKHKSLPGFNLLLFLGHRLHIVLKVSTDKQHTNVRSTALDACGITPINRITAIAKVHLTLFFFTGKQLYRYRSCEAG